ncbi:MAG: tRNA epoxyqueuosine(34) reductase QueG [Actinomycetota bacterium]|nr:tRNA epoxyqueuosine(34) reductase QueG [Actinomycetota bacterium]
MILAAGLTDAVLDVGRSAGLAAVGVAPADILQPARDALHLRKRAGLADVMQFTYRNPDRSTDPQRSMPGAKSIVAAALGYRSDLDGDVAECGSVASSGAVARVARYAWNDYYGRLREGLEAMADVLRAAGHAAEVHADDNHLVDRNVAHLAGLGWYGKNANLLLEGRGSWFVLGGVLTTAPLVVNPTPSADGCHTCRRCLDGCPTGAIVAPGVVDARRCLAWLVQGPGPIPVEFREAVHDRIYGCDDCQEVCPPNRDAPVASSVSLAPIESAPPLRTVPLEFLLTADDATLLAHLGRWYIADRDPDVLRRTALVVLGNIADPEAPETHALLRPYLQHRSGLLREHAHWAAQRLRRRANGSPTSTAEPAEPIA